MHTFADALRVKDGSIFDLLHHSFVERDFVFFAHLTTYLKNVTGCTEEDAMVFAKLSELLYLSSLLHFSVAEQTETTEALRAEKQMPVLLGDLLYGKFISALIEHGKSTCLPTYLVYLKQFNVCGVDAQEGRMQYSMDNAVQLLTEKTAEAMALFSGCQVEPVVQEANAYFSKQWMSSSRETVTTLDALKTLLEREFGQGAMVC